MPEISTGPLRATFAHMKFAGTEIVFDDDDAQRVYVMPVAKRNPPNPTQPCCRCGKLTNDYHFVGGMVCRECFDKAHTQPTSAQRS